LILGATGSGKTSFLNLLANIGDVTEAKDQSLLD
jgi:ABC-type lipoprotein export system ATPase subunit